MWRLQLTYDLWFSLENNQIQVFRQSRAFRSGARVGWWVEPSQRDILWHAILMIAMLRVLKWRGIIASVTITWIVKLTWIASKNDFWPLTGRFTGRFVFMPSEAIDNSSCRVSIRSELNNDVNLNARLMDGSDIKSNLIHFNAIFYSYQMVRLSRRTSGWDYDFFLTRSE